MYRIFVHNSQSLITITITIAITITITSHKSQAHRDTDALVDYLCRATYHRAKTPNAYCGNYAY